MTSARLIPLVDDLMRRAGRGMSLGLDRMHAALAALGNPEKKRQFFHVTGTNGKGSTSAMLESIAREAGFRTGLYTSPHLCRFAERIRVNGAPISDDELADALERVIAVAPEGVTFFEAMTLAAFVAFDAADVEVGVIEVGIGGRLDATNVLERPLGTAITSVALDHTALLGDTHAAIARDKAGLFRRDVPVVLGPLDDEALAAALEVAKDVGARPILRVARPGEVASDAGGVIVFEARALPDGRARIELPGLCVETHLGVAGSHQIGNAAVAAALTAVSSMPAFKALPGLVERGLAAARWPGRLERIDKDGKVVLLDCAHNPHGAAALAEHVRSLAIPPERVVLVFGALADKAWMGMLDVLAPLADRRVYAEPKGRAPVKASELAARFSGVPAPEPRDAITRALAMAAPSDLIVAAGSIYLVGEVRGELLGLACDPVVAL
ncbi:folylpolyglutamate synthase/dihydrofolate synthase family protein [Polyangium sp. 6x1]|uniref:bifunctional folylpolyglutamate synthase/dihydrofolate synthase n=1 Tax=Polyangium sp. 6x1 TaxID=3042689 RepID=UPI002482BDF9|nr:folylpolyglutamate synthase/dihydrofolate synthase family protein [Polyangium sp. 6x1]MDI1444585.1 folylpolyglutamate synthase/dihydrofolate synthase family protein [Polyangium sp. 6x1]